MKKLLISCIIVVMLTSFAAFAEDLSALTLDQLTERRQQLLEELSQVNAAISAASLQQPESTPAPDGTLGRIIDLFPDENLAIMVRTNCGKASIEQTVTQEDLDKVDMLTCIWEKYHDFTGIRYLGNLWYFHTEDNYDGPFPEELRYCRNLTSLYINCNRNIQEVPEWIGELSKLETLSFSEDDIIVLPDSICSLTKLKELDLSRNERLTALPENIGNLTKLDYLNINYTGITSLPASVWNLTPSYFGMDGLPIK